MPRITDAVTDAEVEAVPSYESDAKQKEETTSRRHMVIIWNTVFGVYDLVFIVESIMKCHEIHLTHSYRCAIICGCQVEMNLNHIENLSFHWRDSFFLLDYGVRVFRFDTTFRWIRMFYDTM